MRQFSIVFFAPTMYACSPDSTYVPILAYGRECHEQQPRIARWFTICWAACKGCLTQCTTSRRDEGDGQDSQNELPEAGHFSDAIMRDIPYTVLLCLPLSLKPSIPSVLE